MIKRTGDFTASNASTIVSKDYSLTRIAYISDLAKQKTGHFEEGFKSSSMEHGSKTEVEAFNYLNNSGFFEEELTFLGYLGDDDPKKVKRINENCSAMPDIIMPSGDVIDMKCEKDRVFHSKKYPVPSRKLLETSGVLWNEDRTKVNVPKAYYYQIQMQLIATKGNTGWLYGYLKKPIPFCDPNEIYYRDFQMLSDYEIENTTESQRKLDIFHRKTYFIKIEKNEKVQDMILKKVEELAPIRDAIANKIIGATEIDEGERFSMIDRFKHLFKYMKDCSEEELLTGEYFSSEGNFYILQK